MSVEELHTTKFEFKILSPEEFKDITPTAERLQELVYSIYTCDGVPRSVTPCVLSQLSTMYKQSERKTAYIIARGDTERLFQLPNTDHLKKIETDLRNYKNLAGFFKVEWGVHKPDVNLPIEAMIFTKNSPWPEDKIVGSVASLTINPLLSKETRLEILGNILKASYSIASKEGFSNNIFTILAPHVASFGEAAGATLTRVTEATELSDDPYAKDVFETFSGYWKAAPNLYRIIPNNIV